MPNYNYSQGAQLAGLFPGPSGNSFAPYGDYGPHYNLVTNDAGLRGGGVNTPGNWYQEFNPESTAAAAARYPAGGPRSSDTGGGIAVLDPITGLYYNSSTRQPFTGTDAGGRTYAGGRETGVPVPYSPGQTINPNDPSQRYRAVNIIKSPEIAGATNQLLDTFTKSASTALEDFGKYLSEFKGQLGTAAGKSATATDIGPLSNTLRGQQATYSAALDQASADYARLNPEAAARQQAVIDRMWGQLSEYDAAINRAGDYAAGRVSGDVLARYSAGATPRSAGSGLARELLRNETAIRVPLEQAKIGQRYNILGQYEYPAAIDWANRETARIANFNPMIAAQQFQSGQATEQTIQQLAMVTANMSYDNAIKYMQALSVPWDIQQKILSGEIAQLAGLAQLYGGSRYQGLQDVLGANVTPAQASYFTAPGYPGVTRYQPSQGPASSGPIYPQSPAGQPATVNPDEWKYNPNTKAYYNSRTGQWSRGEGLTEGQKRKLQEEWQWDPSRRQYRNVPYGQYIPG